MCWSINHKGINHSKIFENCITFIKLYSFKNININLILISILINVSFPTLPL